jgi:hypothetical protein
MFMLYVHDKGPEAIFQYKLVFLVLNFGICALAQAPWHFVVFNKIDNSDTGLLTINIAL